MPAHAQVKVLLLGAAAALAAACSGEAVYIESIVALSSRGEPTSSVDTERGYCKGSEGCVDEIFGAQSARVTVRNDAPLSPDEGDGAGTLGRDRITGYILEYVPYNGPTITPVSGGLAVSLAPGSSTTFEVPLAPVEAKGEFGYNTPHARYTIRYTFTGPNHLQLHGSLDLEFGSYDLCGDDEYVDVSDYGARCADEETP